MADFRNNIVYVTAAGNTLSLLDDTGLLLLSHNWFKPGRVSTFGTLDGTITDDGTSVTGSSPGFTAEANQDYHLASGSGAINRGTVLHASTLPANNVVQQYVKHQAGEAEGFGLGRHHCIGAHMARLEMRALLKTLLPRLESAELAAPPRRTSSTMVSGISSLPIRCTWRARAS